MKVGVQVEDKRIQVTVVRPVDSPAVRVFQRMILRYFLVNEPGREEVQVAPPVSLIQGN